MSRESNQLHPAGEREAAAAGFHRASPPSCRSEPLRVPPSLLFLRRGGFHGVFDSPPTTGGLGRRFGLVAADFAQGFLLELLRGVALDHLGVLGPAFRSHRELDIDKVVSRGDGRGRRASRGEQGGEGEQGSGGNVHDRRWQDDGGSTSIRFTVLSRPDKGFRRYFRIIVECGSKSRYVLRLVHALARSRLGALLGESDKFDGNLKPDQREQLASMRTARTIG